MPAHLRSSQHQLGWLVDQGLESYEIKLLIFISASWGGHMPTTGAESLGDHGHPSPSLDHLSCVTVPG